MPADRDGRGAARGALPDVVTDATNNVGFLDVAGLDPTTVAAAIEHAFRSLTVGAVLAVHCVRTTATELGEICGRGDLELITTIRHSTGGTTYTIRRRSTANDDDNGRLTPF